MSSLPLHNTGRAPRPSLLTWRRWWSRLDTVGALFLLVFFCLIFVAPFAWLVITALKSTADLDTFPITWLPSHPQWDNFLRAVTEINYPRYAMNSIVLSTLYSTLVTLSSALVGFGFARLQGRGKRQLFLLMLATLMLPAIVGLIPTYVIFSRLGMIDTYWPWIVGGLGSSPFLSFLFRQFFTSIPPELEEAAIVDGCGYGRIFWQIFLPLSKPVLATSFILSFAGVWGDFLGPSLYLSADNTTLAVAIANGYASAHGETAANVLAAGCVIYMVPVLITFFLAQRYLISGTVTTGLKG